MFRRRTNKLVRIIGIPVIVYGLAKGGMYLKVKKTLDDFIMQNSTRVGIKYSDVETDLRGIVRVNNISVTPVGETEPVSITQLLIKGPDAFSYVLNHNPVTGDQGPPAGETAGSAPTQPTDGAPIAAGSGVDRRPSDSPASAESTAQTDGRTPPADTDQRAR